MFTIVDYTLNGSELEVILEHQESGLILKAFSEVHVDWDDDYAFAMVPWLQSVGTDAFVWRVDGAVVPDSVLEDLEQLITDDYSFQEYARDCRNGAIEARHELQMEFLMGK